MSRGKSKISEQPGVWRTILECGASTPRDRRNGARFALWSVVLGVAIVGSKAWQSFGHLDGLAMWLVGVTPLVPAVLALASYLKLLREADELVRRIQLEGLALGFGTGIVVMVGIQFPRDQFNPDTWHAAEALVMILGWVAGQVWAAWRYR